MENYQTEQNNHVDVPNQLSKESRNQIRQTTPWMTFLSVMGFIAAGLMTLGALIIMLLAPTYGRGSGYLTFVGFIYLIFAAVMAVLANYMYQSANNYKKYCDIGNSELLDKAFTAQKKYWKTTGILTIVFIVLAIIMGIVIAVNYSSLYRY